MKILILANDVAGLICFRKELLEEFVRQYTVYISIPDGDGISEVEAMGCKVEVTPFLDRKGVNMFQDLRLLSYYSQLIKRIRPDIVFTYTIKPNVYGGIACARWEIPYVVNITGLGIALENGGVLQKITLLLYKIGLKRAQKVFFQNEENMNFMLAKGVVKGDYGLLPGSGVNLDKYPLTDYPAEDRTIKFAFISRIMKEKGIDQYLEAAQYIKKRYPDTEFHVCGLREKEYQGELGDCIDKGIIVYHGVIKDVPGFLRNIHCVIHPTYYPEGMSNILLESCACGRPIITTDRAGCREIIDDGQNGFVVKQQDSTDLIHKIELFLKLSINEKIRMGLAGRAKVEKEFNRQIVVEKYMKEVTYGI